MSIRQSNAVSLDKGTFLSFVSVVLSSFWWGLDPKIRPLNVGHYCPCLVLLTATGVSVANAPCFLVVVVGAVQ